MPPKNPKSFWNRQAKTFPRYSPDEDSYEAGMLQTARENGVVFKDKSILDVGCGSGMYTIRLAREGRQVTALDISDEMLAILKADVEKLRIGNIEYVNSPWLDFQDDRCHEVIFCSMTPALTDDEGKEKVVSYSGAQVVYMGWKGGMHSAVMAGLYEYYQVTPDVMSSSPAMIRWLTGKGLKFRSLPKKGQWQVSFAKEDLANHCLDMLIKHDVEPDPAFIGEHLKKFRRDDGSYLEITDYSVEMLIWQND